MTTLSLTPLRPEATERLRERLPERVIKVLAHAVGILVDVSDRNRSQHEPDSGDDAMSLAVRNWRNWWNLMDERLSELDGVDVSWPRGSLQVIVSDFVLHFWSGDDTTAVRFDNGQTKPQVVFENIAQMTLWTEARRSELRHIVLVHEGDAVGLRAVAVGAPQDLGVVGEPWHWHEIVYRGEVSETGEFIRPKVEVPNYREQPLPTPLLSLRETEDSEQAEEPG
ncbi:MAG: hypothetical protein H0U03_10770 [Actinobacteria bacterium]|nr:hypothetical protein [Actinomycetota bacterium]